MAKFDMEDDIGFEAESEPAPKMKRSRSPIGADTEKVRNPRPPIFDQHDRHYFPKNPAYYRVWVTDVKNQVNDFLRWGFTFVEQSAIAEEEGRIGEGDPRQTGSVDTRVQINVGRAHVKDNAVAYLMQLPMDVWLEAKKYIAEERQRPIREIKGQIEGMKRQGYYGGMTQNIENLR